MQKTAAITLTLAALAAAQGLSSLSQQCQQGVTNIASNTEASSCLAINQLTNLLIPSNASVITPVQNWLNAFCAAKDCDNSTIQTVATDLSTACATDLQSLDVSSAMIQTIIPYIQQYFTTAKDILCLADTSKSEFCWIEIGTATQTALGKPLSLEELFDAVSTATNTGESPVNSSVICTTCTQGMISILDQNTQLSSIVDIKSVASDVCGADFAATTTMPVNIAIGTGAAVPKGTGGGSGGAATLAVSSMLSTAVGVALVALLA